MAKISYDRSDTSVVVTCDECPYWYAFAWTMPEAYASGANHQVLVHGVEQARAERPGVLYLRRHAVAG